VVLAGERGGERAGELRALIGGDEVTHVAAEHVVAHDAGELE